MNKVRKTCHAEHYKPKIIVREANATQCKAGAPGTYLCSRHALRSLSLLFSHTRAAEILTMVSVLSPPTWRHSPGRLHLGVVAWF
uniref:Uncharacterized protein n=1 Tax=Rhipicephalus microplus TaxID=6941 RepID=A0A6G5A0A9_RHIMP